MRRYFGVMSQSTTLSPKSVVEECLLILLLFGWGRVSLVFHSIER